MYGEQKGKLRSEEKEYNIANSAQKQFCTSCHARISISHSKIEAFASLNKEPQLPRVSEIPGSSPAPQLRAAPPGPSGPPGRSLAAPSIRVFSARCFQPNRSQLSGSNISGPRVSNSAHGLVLKDTRPIHRIQSREAEPLREKRARPAAHQQPRCPALRTTQTRPLAALPWCARAGRLDPEAVPEKRRAHGGVCVSEFWFVTALCAGPASPHPAFGVSR